MGYLKYNYDKYVRRDLIAKLNYNDVNSIINLEKVTVRIFLKNVEDVRLNKVLLGIKFLEGISGIRPMLKYNLKNSKIALKYQLNSVLICSVVLRKVMLGYFMDYIHLVVLPAYIKRYGLPVVTYNKHGEYNLYFNDTSVFYDLGELSLMSDPIVITLHFGDSTLEEVLMYLNGMFFMVKKG